MRLSNLRFFLGMAPHLRTTTLGDLSRFALTGNRGGVNWMGAILIPLVCQESEASRA